jgi:hypothetical protein
MSHYEDRFSNALLMQKIGEVEHRLSNLDSEAGDRAHEQVPGGPERLGAVLEQATAVIGIAKPELISQGQINQIVETLDLLGTRIQQFEANEFAWSEVDGVADTLVDRLSGWPHAAGIPPDEVKEAASRFRRSAGMLLSNLEADALAVRTQIQEQQETADELQAKTAETKTATDAEIESLRAIIEEQKGRLEEAIRTNQGQFSEAQERRVTEFRDELTEFEGRMNALQTQSTEALKSQEARLEQDIDTAHTEIQEKLDEAERIVGAIATTGTVGGFQREAGSQKQTADRLRVAALATAAVAAIVAILGVIHASNGGNGTDVAAKALASFVFFGIAGYLATQSGKHRDREERAQRLELELAAFGPFINDLPEDKQNDLVEKLADRIFGHEPTSSAGNDGNGVTEEQLTMLSQLLTLFKAAGS